MRNPIIVHRKISTAERLYPVDREAWSDMGLVFELDGGRSKEVASGHVRRSRIDSRAATTSTSCYWVMKLNDPD